MMGHQHALGATAAWLAAAPAIDMVAHLSAPQVALGAVLAAGGGMLPDLDQHGSTVARTYGPVTNVLARVVGWLAGGHRNGTHSLLGLALLGVLAWALAVPLGVPWLTTWLLLGIGFRGLRERRTRWYHQIGLSLFAAAVTGVLWLAGLPVALPVIGGAVIGAASHIALDMLTPQRCPVWWLPEFLVRILRRCGRRGQAVARAARKRYGVGLVTTGSRWTSPIVTWVLTAAVGASAFLALVAA